MASIAMLNQRVAWKIKLNPKPRRPTPAKSHEPSARWGPWAPGKCPSASPSAGPACLAETSMFTSGFKVQGELEPGQVSLDRQLILKLAARGQWKWFRKPKHTKKHKWFKWFKWSITVNEISESLTTGYGQVKRFLHTVHLFAARATAHSWCGQRHGSFV